MPSDSRRGAASMWPATPTWLLSSVHRGATERLIAAMAALGRNWAATGRCGKSRFADVPLVVEVDAPERVGMDRLMGAVAADRLRPADRAAIVVDLGTATKVVPAHRRGRVCRRSDPAGPGDVGPGTRRTDRRPAPRRRRALAAAAAAAGQVDRAGDRVGHFLGHGRRGPRTGGPIVAIARAAAGGVCHRRRLAARGRGARRRCESSTCVTCRTWCCPAWRLSTRLGSERCRRRATTRVIELTPPGAAAVAVVLVDGPEAVGIGRRVFASRRRSAAGRVADRIASCVGRWGSRGR